MTNEIQQFFEQHPIPKNFKYQGGIILNGKKFVESHLRYASNDKSKTSVIYLNRLIEIKKSLEV